MSIAECVANGDSGGLTLAFFFLFFVLSFFFGPCCAATSCNARFRCAACFLVCFPPRTAVPTAERERTTVSNGNSESEPPVSFNWTSAGDVKLQ